MAEKPFDPVEIIESVAGESAAYIRRMAVAILQTVVTATPVGDPTLWQSHPNKPPGYVGGHARRNWAVSLGSPLSGSRGMPGRGPGEGAATSQAIKTGKNRIKEFRNTGSAAGQDVSRLIIQNNVPYITRLNAGHSAQAPANFVEQAVMVGSNVGRNDRKDLP